MGLWLLWPSAITRENAVGIQEGMSIAKVESILGGPPRDESTGPLLMADFEFRLDDPFVPSRPSLGGSIEAQWRSDAVVVDVMIDRNGRVETVDIHRTTPRLGVITAFVRRWLWCLDL